MWDMTIVMLWDTEHRRREWLRRHGDTQMTLREYVRGRLDAGATVEQAWRDAKRDRWHAPWNYVAKIHREWLLEKDAPRSHQEEQ
jgi:hypothetical protein